MTDPRIPEDDLGAESFEGLDLESLADGVHPGSGQWATIGAAASHRRHRRTWLLAVSAVLVLLAGSATVLLGRSNDDSVSISAGSIPADAFVLPPKDATILSARESGGAYAFTYQHDGTFYSLSTTVTQGQTTIPPPDVLAYTFPATTDTFGTIYLSCAVYATAVPSDVTVGTSVDDREVTQATIPDDRPVTFSGPTTANWLLPTQYVTLRPMAGDDEPCTPPTEPDVELLSAVDDLRLGTRSEWEELLGRSISDGPSDVPATAPTVPSAITPGAPEDAPADRGSAEEQIAAAVAGFNDQAADGSYPNLEAGTTKAAEYREMFDLAARQSGATRAGDDSDNTSKLGQVRFVTPERATITIDFTAKLPTGTFTFLQQGEAILEGGNWVVTYRTVITTLGRACTPPGGYDGCPDTGSSGNGVNIVPAA
jgi:hypothetical protein